MSWLQSSPRTAPPELRSLLGGVRPLISRTPDEDFARSPVEAEAAHPDHESAAHQEELSPRSLQQQVEGISSAERVNSQNSTDSSRDSTTGTDGIAADEGVRDSVAENLAHFWNLISPRSRAAAAATAAANNTKGRGRPVRGADLPRGGAPHEGEGDGFGAAATGGIGEVETPAVPAVVPTVEQGEIVDAEVTEGEVLVNAEGLHGVGAISSKDSSAAHLSGFGDVTYSDGRVVTDSFTLSGAKETSRGGRELR